MKIRNDRQLKIIMSKALEEVVDYVVQKIWNENKQDIRIMIYEGYQPEIYQRTEQFKNTWQTKTNRMGLQGIAQGEFFYESNELVQNRALMQHNATQYLADIIYKGLAGNFEEGYAKNDPAFKGQAWTQKRDVWKVIDKYVGARKVKELFEEAMKYNGIKYHWRGQALKVVKTKDN